MRKNTTVSPRLLIKVWVEILTGKFGASLDLMVLNISRPVVTAAVIAATTFNRISIRHPLVVWKGVMAAATAVTPKRIA